MALGEWESESIPTPFFPQMSETVVKHTRPPTQDKTRVLLRNLIQPQLYLKTIWVWILGATARYRGPVQMVTYSRSVVCVHLLDWTETSPDQQPNQRSLLSPAVRDFSLGLHWDKKRIKSFCLMRPVAMDTPVVTMTVSHLAAFPANNCPLLSFLSHTFVSSLFSCSLLSTSVTSRLCLLDSVLTPQLSLSRSLSHPPPLSFPPLDHCYFCVPANPPPPVASLMLTHLLLISPQMILITPLTEF